MNLAKWKAHGTVRTLRTEFAEPDLVNDGWLPPRHFTIATFHPDGRISRSDHHNPDGSVSHTEYSYDAVGRLVETSFQMNHDAVSRHVRYYDPAGRHVRTVLIGADGIERDTEAVAYDPMGRKSEVRLLGPEQPGVARMYGVAGTEQVYGSGGATTMTINHDESGLPVEVLFRDAERLLLERVSFERDAHGRLLSEALIIEGATPFPDLKAELFGEFFGQGRTLFKTTYVYDGQGSMVERRTETAQLSEERHTFSYDARGNVREKVSEHRNRDAQVDDAGVVSYGAETSRREEWRFHYQYDEWGNWTEKVTWGRAEPNPNFTPSNIERRAFSYW